MGRTRPGTQVNVDRRQLTDAQLTLLGEQIAPDLAEAARRRMAHVSDTGDNPYGQVSVGVLSLVPRWRVGSDSGRAGRSNATRG